MENAEIQSRRSIIDVAAGRTAEGKPGVTLFLDREAIVSFANGESRPGVVFLPWNARLFAYALLREAEAVEHGAVAVVER